MRLALFLLATALHAQTLGQFRLVDFTARTAGTVSAVTLGANPAVATSAAHGYTTGTPVWIYEPWTITRRETDAVGNAVSGNRGRGYFIITVTDSTHFTLASEMYTNATNLTAYTVAVGDKIVPLTTYTLRDGPRVWLDGPISKGAWSSSTTYRSHEMVTSGGVSYVSMGDANLNHAPPDSTWWFSVDPAKIGPGTFTASLRDTSGKASVAGTYTPLKSMLANLTTYEPSGSSYYDYTLQDFGMTGWIGQSNVLKWFMTGDSTAYARALQLATRAEDLAGGTTGCDTNPPGGASNLLSYCGSRNTNDMDYERLFAAIHVPAIAMLYDTLTPSQKTGLLDRFLNDKDVLHNGGEASGTTACVEEPYRSGGGTITVAGNTSTGVQVVTGSGFSSMADMQPGTIIFQGTPLRGIGRVQTVDSDTQLTLEPIVKTQAVTIASGFAWYYVRPWAYGGARTCGWVHWIKHVTSTPHMIPGLETSWSSGTNYGALEDDWDACNRTIAGLTPFIAIGLTFGKDDLRAVRLGEQAINYYMTQAMAQYYKSRMTGKDAHGTEYGTGRTENFIAQIALMLKNSLTVTPPGVTSGSYLTNLLSSYQYATWLSKPGWLLPWAVGYPTVTKFDGTDPAGSTLYNMGKPLLYAAELLKGTTWAAATYDYLRNRRTVSNPFWTQSYASAQDGWSGVIFLTVATAFYDPLATATSPTTQPAYLIQNTSDIAECIAAGLYCVADANTSHLWSATGWSTSDLQVAVDGAASLPISNEDSYATAGNVNIIQNSGLSHGAYMLGGNGVGSSGLGAGVMPFSGAEHGNTISFYDSATSADLFPSKSNSMQYAAMDRAGGGTGYTYSRVNLTPTLREASTGYASGSAVQKNGYLASAGATRVHRHVVHIGSHVFVYDDVAASASHQIRAYWHYEMADFANPPVRHSDWLTSIDASARTTVLTVPGVGRLSSKMLTVNGANSIALTAENADAAWCRTVSTYNPSGSCAGNYTFRDPQGAGLSAAIDPGTYRTHVCASTDGGTCANATSAEWLAVHRSVTSETDTMPTITQPTCTATGGTCAAVEVQDASAPAVAVFARNGVDISGAAFTTTHSGTGRYVVAGVGAGHYSIFKGGSLAASADVADGVNSFSFTSTSGVMSIVGGPVVTATPDTLSFACTLTGADPASQTTAIGATGATLTNWSAAKTQSWLTISPTSGSAAGNLTASVACAGLTEGTYSDTITIPSTTPGITNSPITVPVSLTVYSLPSISTVTLPWGAQRTAYSQSLAGSGGQAPRTWAVSSGALCAGLTLSSGGLISGTPTTAGDCTFTAQLADAAGVGVSWDYTLHITAASSSRWSNVQQGGQVVSR